MKASLKPWAQAISLAVFIMALVLLPFLLFETEIKTFIESRLHTGAATQELTVLIVGALALDAFLPIPSNFINIASGALLGFAAATMVCWVGLMLGCMLGYWAGFAGRTAVRRRLVGDSELERAAQLSDDVGIVFLILARPVPVLAEVSTMAAGAARYSFARFCAIVALGNLGLASACAAIGAFAYQIDAFVVAFAGAVVVPVVGFAARQLWHRFGRRATPDKPGDPV